MSILGVYGKGNLGDEALLVSIREDFRRVFPNVSFQVFCSDPDYVGKTQSRNDTAVARSPFPGLAAKLRVLRRADVFVLGGGTLLYDQENWRRDLSAVAAVFFWPILAKLLGVRTFAYAQGLGPARHRIIRLAIRYLLRQMDVITLRDTESAALLGRIAGNAISARATCDPVVTSLRFSPSRLRAQKAAGLPGRPYAVVAFRVPYGGDRQHLKTWARAVALFQGQCGLDLMLLPVQWSKRFVEDEAVLDEVRHLLEGMGVPATALRERRWHSLEEGALLLQSARIVISNRLHGLLLAARAGVPIVGVGDGGKIRGCLDDIGFGGACHFMQQGEFSAKEAAGVLIGAYCAPMSERERLKGGVMEWAGRRPSNMDVIAELLDAGAESSSGNAGGWT